MIVPLLTLIRPEVLLAAMACVLFLVGTIARPAARRLAPWLALLALIVVFAMEVSAQIPTRTITDSGNTIRLYEFATYVKMLASGVGIMLVLLAWPTDADGTGNSAMNFAEEAGEFFGLMLLSITGIFLVASANDMILLFLGIELASIPMYIMVSISRPLAVAQEAGVKYFFLGAMAAAVMLFGFSYLYGSTGTTDLHKITEMLGKTVTARSGPTVLTTWQMLAVVMILAGFTFKIAAVPFHFYAGDVYQGAATPVTAFLAFVPKTSGMVAIIKLLYTISGGGWTVGPEIAKLLWIVAVLTMSAGNVLGLLQFNVKRVLAYSSIAHSGYMLVGITTLVTTTSIDNQHAALQGVLFYLAAYGIMNAGAFGVLMMLPSQTPRPATSAETFEDIAGQGRRHVGLGLAMAVCCFSLTGLPFTIGFFGKFYLIKPALHGQLYGLVIIMMINAAISAAYYLKIVAAMFLRPEADSSRKQVSAPMWPIRLSVGISVIGTLVFGTIFPATDSLSARTGQAAAVESDQPLLLPAGAAVSAGDAEANAQIPAR